MHSAMCADERQWPQKDDENDDDVTKLVHQIALAMRLTESGKAYARKSGADIFMRGDWKGRFRVLLYEPCDCLLKGVRRGF
jgi:hypothetical protein